MIGGLAFLEYVERYAKMDGLEYVQLPVSRIFTMSHFGGLI